MSRHKDDLHFRLGWYSSIALLTSSMAPRFRVRALTDINMLAPKGYNWYKESRKVNEIKSFKQLVWVVSFFWSWRSPLIFQETSVRNSSSSLVAFTLALSLDCLFYDLAESFGLWLNRLNIPDLKVIPGVFKIFIPCFAF